MAMSREEIIKDLEYLSDHHFIDKSGIRLYLEKDFMTKQCNVMVFSTDTQIFGDTVWCIVSRHLNNDDVNVRFGNYEQIESIINTYHIERQFKL